LADGGDEVIWDDHHGLAVILVGGLVFRHGFLLRLSLVVIENPSDSL